MSIFKQDSFIGGMNILLDDTRIATNQYRLGINVRNRYDSLQPIRSSVIDPAAPLGIKQECVTFGNYIILFVAGLAYYRYYIDTGWRQIVGFSMSSAAPRFWTVPVPVGLTNYIRRGVTDTTSGSGNSQLATLLSVAGAGQGNLPGLLVQDNVNQPTFIFLDNNGIPTSRTTQTFAQWSVTYTDATNTVIVTDGDQREYVPIGNAMCWDGATLYITSQDYNYIYRSVTGRPLDFVVNVSNVLATVSPFTEVGGGDATTTSYSVGVGGISCLRAMSDGSIFVSASNANFSVLKNTTPNAPTIFGEYTFIRKFLFNSTNLSDRTIMDTQGDTRFIDITGVRSFNAVQQLQNEGRNSQFTANIQQVFTGIIQDYTHAAAILYDNYELYGVNTILGPVIAVYDTINSCWVGFDTTQTGGKRIKQFAKIELTIQRLYAITEDDELYTLYSGMVLAPCLLRTGAFNTSVISSYSGQAVRINDPATEIKIENVRVILNNIVEDCSLTVTPFIDNRITATDVETKTITYVQPEISYTGSGALLDVNSMLYNGLFSFPNCEQGWDAFVIIEWTGNSSLTQFSVMTSDETPLNPMNSQANQ